MNDGFSSSLFGGRQERAAPATPGGPTGAASSGDPIKDVSTASFAADVIQASRAQPVIVDFWAPWCGPCKQLTPVLEKVVRAAGGRVRLAKMNIDDHPSIPGQLGVRSIPAVFAFVDGRPVDGFMGALPESEVAAFVDRLVGARADDGDPVAATMDEARELMAGGDVRAAAQLFAAVLDADAAHPGALAGLADCYLELGDTAGAEELLAGVPADVRRDPAFAGVTAKLKLAAEVSTLGNPAALRERITANADDHQARFDLALIAQARNDRAEAAELLLEIVRRDRAWNDDGGRRKLLEFFEMWGPMDPATKDARRRLSTVLFS